MKVKKKTKRSWKNDKKSENSSASDSDSDSNIPNDDHDLSVHAGNSIKLMTEVFKILGDKKLKEMVPNILKPIGIDDLKACLVEESMALSKKRITAILNGETYSSASSDDSDIDQPVDIISLDGISDDSDIFCFDDLPEAEMLTEVKKEPNEKKCKRKLKKKGKVVKESKVVAPSGNVEKAMTALEILELQARARAIKSQLALESCTSPLDHVDEEIKEENFKKESVQKSDTSSTPDATVVEAPPKKVKLRRDHLRIDPNRTKTKEKKKSPSPVLIPKASPQKPRRGSSDSIILESPSHPLIVITSSEDEENKKLTKEPSSSEEGEVTSETEKPKKVCAKRLRKKAENLKKIVQEVSSDPNEKKEEPTKIKKKKHKSKKSSLEEIAKISEKEENPGEITDNKEDTELPTKEQEIDDSDVLVLRSETNEIEDESSQDHPVEKVDEDFIAIDSEPDFDSDYSESKTDNDSWKNRWLGSRKVKNVLQTSKLCNNVKRKVTSKKVLKKQESLDSPSSETSVKKPSESDPNYNEGSVDHFKMLKETQNSKND